MSSKAAPTQHDEHDEQVTPAHVEDGLETTTDGYDLYETYRDSGAWWLRNRETGGVIGLGATKDDAARWLREYGHTRA